MTAEIEALSLKIATPDTVQVYVRFDGKDLLVIEEKIDLYIDKGHVTMRVLMDPTRGKASANDIYSALNRLLKEGEPEGRCEHNSSLHTGAVANAPRVKRELRCTVCSRRWWEKDKLPGDEEEDEVVENKT